MTEQDHIFLQWIQQYQGVIFKVLHAYCEKIEDREDLFQEIGLQLWKSIPRFKGEAKETTWIYRVALNTAMHWRRKENSRKRRQTSLETRHHSLHIHAPAYDGEVEWLYAEIRKLEKIDRSLILLFLDGLTYQDMAKVIGISETNVGAKLHRIKSKLSRAAKELRNGSE